MELYAILKIVWAVMVGVLFIGLGTMVGMDMGVGTLLRFVGRNDAERRTALNIIGPHWDGNQVWFILGGRGNFCRFSHALRYIVLSFLCGHDHAAVQYDPAPSRI